MNSYGYPWNPLMESMETLGMSLNEFEWVSILHWNQFKLRQVAWTTLKRPFDAFRVPTKLLKDPGYHFLQWLFVDRILASLKKHCLGANVTFEKIIQTMNFWDCFDILDILECLDVEHFHCGFPEKYTIVETSNVDKRVIYRNK